HDERTAPPHQGGAIPPPASWPAHVVAEDLQATAMHGQHQMAHDEHTGHAQHADHGGGQHPAGGAHAGHGEAMFARPFWIALVLTAPVLLYAEPIEHLLGYTAPRFPGWTWLVPGLASVIYWYCGWVFLTGALAELRSRQP